MYIHFYLHIISYLYLFQFCNIVSCVGWKSVFLLHSLPSKSMLWQ
ncbi:hypothetical protein M6B38_133825 [Iris pallida]|uniref:Uncharacterized protein n=1 Tax=Iris pallida TaxID=29817 RepID=A0AAX6FGM4_IRIPA|nr:hypothetical protein M6B38_133825 [Iris pallida]